MGRRGYTQDEANIRPMILRPVAIEDVPRLTPLMGTLGYPTTEERLRGGLAAILADPSYRTIVAEEGDRIVGLAGMRRGLRYEAGLFSS
jgi:hypothetical protein